MLLRRPIDDLLPRLQASIDGFDPDMALTFATDAIIQFCRESHLIRYVECFTPTDCATSLRLTKLKDDERLGEVLSLRLFNGKVKLDNVQLDYMVDGNTLYIDETPCGVTTIELEYSVLPKRESEFIYDLLYEEWLEPIIHLTLHKLYMMADTEWGNPNLSQWHLQAYEKALYSARYRKISKVKAIKPSLRPHRLSWGK